MTLEFSSLDNLIVLKTIRYGPHAKVKAVKYTESDVIYAAKIYKSGIPECILRNEEAFCGQISGPNIIRVAAVSSEGIYRKKSGHEFTCFYILMEFCVNGDLFSFANLISPMPEEILRYFFLQIISAIETCHTSRICHRIQARKHPDHRGLHPQGFLLQQILQTREPPRNIRGEILLLCPGNCNKQYLLR